MVGGTERGYGLVASRAFGDRRGASSLSGQQRVALGAAQVAAGMLAEEEDHESEDQAEADREGEGTTAMAGRRVDWIGAANLVHAPASVSARLAEDCANLVRLESSA